MTILEVFNILIDAITGAFSFANEIFEGLELMPYLIGGFAIFTIYRLLIVPFLGSGGSDSVKKDKNSKGDKGNG